MANQSVPVLIVGGGPIGLALAAELGWQGARCLLVERTDGVVSIPKMNEVNTRSMEFVRRWGIAEAVLDTPFPPDWPKDVVFVTSLAGYELGRMPRPPRGQRSSEHSPEQTQTCSQHWFDPILQRFARAQPGVELRYRTELRSFVEHPAGVTAELVDVATGAVQSIEADYLVGCDGAGSFVRRTLDIPMSTFGARADGSLGHAINIFFRAPRLLERCGRAPGTFFITCDEAGVWGNLRIIDPAQAIWRLMVNQVDPETTPESVDRGALLRRAIGRDVEVEWIDVNVWHRRSLVADSYGRGRVLLAGDAVHQVSPTGALGMNTGLGDAVDLGWKLAATFAGWGGRNLIASYDAERRPIGQRNVRMATRFHGLHGGYGDENLAIIGSDTDAGAGVRQRVGQRLVARLGAEFRTVGLQIGYAYSGSPIIVDDGSATTADEAEVYHPSSRPGARAPHAWLEHGRSVLDLFSRGFVLLRLGADEADAGPLEAAAARVGMPLTTVAVDVPEARALYQRRLVLVRPDGHVAWRGDAAPADAAAAVVDRVRGALGPA